MVAPSGDEQVRYDILIDAKVALNSMRELLKATSDNTEKIQLFSSLVVGSAKAWGTSWQQALNVYKQLNAELSKSHEATLFGRTGGQDLFAKSEQYVQSAMNAKRVTDDVAESAQKVGQAAQGAGQTAQSAFDRVFSSVNALRIALGAIISMILFQGIQAFQNFFQGAIKNASELEASLYRLHNAERILSNEGVQVTTQGLEDGIKRIKKLLPIFSKEDVTGLVGQIAITTKELGLTEKQITDLAQSIAVLNVNSAQEETLQQTAQHVISSLLTSNAKGVANLGIVMGDAAIQAKAFEMGMLQAGESANNLSDAEKKIVKVQIAIDAGASSIAGLNEYLDSNTAKLQMNAAAWNDIKTSIGQVILPFIPALTAGFQALNDAINTSKALFASWLAGLLTFTTVLRMVLAGNIKSMDELKEKFAEVNEEAKKLTFRQFFPEGSPENAPDWFKSSIGKYLTNPETPTGPGTGDMGDAQAKENQAKAIADAEQKIQDIMKDSADKKLDIERDYQRKLEDIARDYAQRLEDIARNTAQKREDALRNYNQKVEDINRDAAQKIQDAKREEHKKEIDREAQFQQRLKELREKFLLSLEDALHERDARQVLRLIRQYNMDKQNLEERHKLEREQAKKDLAAKLQDIEYERQKKLEAARRDYEQRLQDIAIQEARERQEASIQNQRKLADARLWHQRQLQEQREYLQRKLRDLADALKKEFQLTQQGAQAITSMLQSTFGQIGAGMTPVVGSGAVTGGSLGNGSSWSQLQNTWNSLLSTWQNSGLYGTGGMAEGGNMLATRPTKVTVGERGPEMLSVTPLDKIGNNIGKLFGDKSALDNGGSIKIALELSPDLEARIIDSSLEGFAVNLEQLVRSK